MRLYSAIAALILCAFFSAPAKAWNCNDPLASRVDVGSTKPAGATAGDADGQYYKGSDATNPNDYYVCQVPKPPTSTPSAQTQSQNQSQSQNQTSTSNSKSSSDSNSSANNTLKLSNVGNSSNTNTNNATGGQGGAGYSTASNSGNNSFYNSETNIQAPHIPVEQAFAYAAQPTVNCAMTYGAGGQGSSLGLSFTGTHIDKNCAILETARRAPNRLAYCKVYIKDKYAHDAGVTLQDCMLADQQPVPVAISETKVSAPAPTPIVIQLTTQPAVAPTPIATVTTEQKLDYRHCQLVNGALTNACKRDLDDAVLALRHNADAKLRLIGPWQSASAVEYLRGKIDVSRIGQPSFSDDQNNNLTLQLYWVN